MSDREPATNAEETLYRHGKADASGSNWDKAEAKTGRPNDLGSVTPEYALENSTLASRAAAAKKSDERRAQAKTKQVSEAENKAVAKKSTRTK
jgi:hypothetical protein